MEERRLIPFLLAHFLVHVHGDKRITRLDPSNGIYREALQSLARATNLAISFESWMNPFRVCSIRERAKAQGSSIENL